VVNAAICEDANAIAVSSYQGGHTEYFLYMRELLDKVGAQHIKLFGGGGGVITPKEIKHLEDNGISKIYSPEDGMKMGLEGIIEDMITKAAQKDQKIDLKKIDLGNPSSLEIASIITTIEDTGEIPVSIKDKDTPTFGITGTGGAGKSSLIDELLLRFSDHLPEKKIALVSVDPTRKRTNGALLGDRIRLGSAEAEQIYIRSLATRSSGTELSPHIGKVVQFLKSCPFDLIIVETSGIGQAADTITDVTDKCMYVMTPEFGAQSQLEKIEMLDAADFIAVNKFEKPSAEDALRDVRKQFKRNRKKFDMDDEAVPVYGTIASVFNDPGVNSLFQDICQNLGWEKSGVEGLTAKKASDKRNPIIPASRLTYLRTIVDTCRKYKVETKRIEELLHKYESFLITKENISSVQIDSEIEEVKSQIGADVLKQLDQFESSKKEYDTGEVTFKVRDKELKQKSKYTSLSHLDISRVGTPKFTSLRDKYRFIREENLPGSFPYTSGIFPFKRTEEEPKRMFAGEGGPLRTNERFHFLSKDDPAKRLSTAFDSVTLYGEDPEERPDIYGKIGEAGVSICTLQDMQDLFKGFELTNPNTSVSMTINGPASIILAMFMNAAMKQELQGDDYFDVQKRIEVMQKVRGTVQADILKEDQAQNTCIFSLNFALKLMGDVQEYFCRNHIKNYYTVSISGYHIAEAGANPISQLAFTLANGFTYVEYYLSRGMKIDEFANNLSFFFSNGLDPEYTVIGRVARRIWSVAMRDFYGANTKSQKLKYHIQTSGRSLHAQEIDFNDIRTTLQAFLALSDNCNSLHTNAYDEAITTPTEESVRRAMAIQMIINREFGVNKTDNPLQGAFIVDELTDLVEEAVLDEFERISDRGGVLGAMETMYQRGKIQEESHYYESKKDSGELPIIGVNTYIAKDIESKMNQEIDLSRSSVEEKNDQINRLRDFQGSNKEKSLKALESLREVVLNDGNIFEELLMTVNYCSLGEITNLLYKVGGKYRRNM
jgi:methylmalonyl-CoA mutase